MNKEKLMKLISEAIDAGASISVHMLQTDYRYEWGVEGREVKQETAQHYIQQFKKAVGSTKEIIADKNDSHAHSFSFYDGDLNFHACCSYVPIIQKGFLQEDVDLSGGEEHAS